jgi:hypothetical protein
MVPVEVSDEDPARAHERYIGPHELSLSALAAVEKDDVLPCLDGNCCYVPLGARISTAGSEKDDPHRKLMLIHSRKTFRFG